jgi:hypothetical protein
MILDSSGIWAFGYNGTGCLGLGDTHHRLKPVQLKDLNIKIQVTQSTTEKWELLKDQLEEENPKQASLFPFIVWEQQLGSLQESFEEQLLTGKIPMAQWDAKWKLAHQKATTLKSQIDEHQQQLDQDQILFQQLQIRMKGTSEKLISLRDEWEYFQNVDKLLAPIAHVEFDKKLSRKNESSKCSPMGAARYFDVFESFWFASFDSLV